MSLKVKFMHECSAHQVVLTPSMKELKLNSEEVKHDNFLRFILFAVKRKNVAGVLGKISAQPHTTLCIQFLDRENNDKNNTLPLGKQICFIIVRGCAEILPKFLLSFLSRIPAC